MKGLFKAKQSAHTPSAALSIPPFISCCFSSVISILPLFFPSSLHVLYCFSFVSFLLSFFPLLGPLFSFSLFSFFPFHFILRLLLLFSLSLSFFTLPFFRPPLLSVCMTHFLGPGPINHSVVGLACLPPCLAALPHHSR